MSDRTRVPIIGVGNDGLAGLTARSRDLLAAAAVVVGSESVLRLLPELEARHVPVGGDLTVAVNAVRDNADKPVAVVAGGDPLFYGIANYLCEQLGEDRFEVVPHVSSMQLAFARVKVTWGEAYLTDLSVRPLAEAIDSIRSAETVGLFPSDDCGPARVARELLARGVDYFRGYVCENLGGKDERVTQGELADIADTDFGPLSVMILKRKPGRPDAVRRQKRLRRFGNPDEAFAQSRPKAALITGAEVRALALAKLDLHPGQVMWDVGAGTGSVALEAAQLVAPGTAYAVEEDAADFHLLVENARYYGVANVEAVHGSAPEVFAGLPAPDAVFIGGDGGEVTRLFEAAFAALKPGGRLAVNVATLEMLHAVYAAARRLAGPAVSVTLLNVSRGVEQLETLRLEAINPTFIVVIDKSIS